MNKIRVVHYLNQFFGQIGGEADADVGFSTQDGPVGPGRLLAGILGDDFEIVGTIICGDNRFAVNIEESVTEALSLARPFKPDLLIAGPAFAAGRYGISCGAFCSILGNALNIPAVTGMFEENPGVELYRRGCWIVKTGNMASTMETALKSMAKLANKIARGEKGTKILMGENIGTPTEDEYFPRDCVKNIFTEKTAAERAVDMLLAKMRKEPFVSELTMPKYVHPLPPPPVKNLATSRIAVVSDGGLCPVGNPDGMSGRGNTVWAVYDMDDMFPENGVLPGYDVAHTGYYGVEVQANPERMIPASTLRDLEKNGVIGKFHRAYYCTSGNATVRGVCEKIGDEMAGRLKEEGVEGVILTST